MNIFDPRTIYISYIISNFLCAAVVFSLWLQDRKRLDGLGFWLADFIMQFVSMALFGLRGLVPESVSILLSLPIGVSGTYLLYVGMERYLHKPSRQPINLLLLAAYIFVHAYFSLIQADMQARTINFSVIMVLFNGQIAWLLLRRVDRKMHPGNLAASVIFLIYLLVSLVRLAIDLLIPPDADIFKYGLYDTLAILVYQMLFIGLTFTLILMVNRRLFSNLENDMHIRTQAEAALKLSEEKFSTAFQNSPDIFLISRLTDGRIIEANESFFRVGGYSQEESLGKTTLELDFWRKPNDRKKYINALRKTGRKINFETTLRKKSGEFFTAWISSAIIHLDGEPHVLSIIKDISEKKRDEQALVESERRYRLLFESMMDGFALHEMIYDAKGKPCDYRFLEVNTAFEKMTGLKAGDIIGKTVREVLPDVEELWIRKYGRVVQTGRSTRFVNFSEAIGKYFEIVAFSPHKDQFATVIVDVSEKKQMDDVLKESEERLKFSQRVAHVGHWSWDTLKNKVTWSDEMCRIFGLDPREFDGDLEKILTRAIHPDDREKVDAANQSVINEARPIPLEYRVIWPDGSEHIVWGEAGERILDTDGRIIRLSGIVQDITERRRSEAALRESEEHFRRAVAGAPFPIMIHAEDGEVLTINDTWTRLTGYSHRDIPTTAAWTEKAYGTHKELVQADIDGLYSLDGPEDEGEYVIMTQSGESRTWHFNSAPIGLMADGRRLVISMALDVSDRKMAEAEIRRMNEELERRVSERTNELREAHDQLIKQEKLAVLGQLAGGVGHELRNPLSIILNAVYYLKLVQPQADDKTNQYFRMIEQETHHAGKIISDLLDFARTTSADRAAVRVDDLMQNVLNRFPAPASVEVELNQVENLPSVFVDQQQIEQVLGNLVINACQAMKDGGRLTIRAELREAEGMEARGGLKAKGASQQGFVAVEVQDTGSGISPENMKKLFEPLFTTKPKGIGLGLPVSRRLAEANGGRIEVESEPGKGSTFTLFLPVTPGNLPVRQAAS